MFKATEKFWVMFVLNRFSIALFVYSKVYFRISVVSSLRSVQLPTAGSGPLGQDTAGRYGDYISLVFASSE